MKRTMICVMTVLALMLMPMTVFAGNGDGSGGGKSQGLTIASASIEDGAVIDPEDSITLTFSKNVVNKKVRDINLPLFVLKNEGGEEVAIEVVMADDQVEPDKKNDVLIQPASPLAEGSYTLTAQAGITSKSETVMAEDYILTFRVGAAPTEATTEAPTEASTEAPTQAPAQQRGNNGTMWMVAAVVAGAAAAVAAVLKKRK